MRARWLAFVLRCDVPGWQLYARRLSPLALGAVLGFVLWLGLSLVPEPWRWWLLLAFALAGIWRVWRMDRELVRLRRDAEGDLARFRAALDDETRPE